MKKKNLAVNKARNLKHKKMIPNSTYRNRKTYFYGLPAWLFIYGNDYFQIRNTMTFTLYFSRIVLLKTIMNGSIAG